MELEEPVPVRDEEGVLLRDRDAVPVRDADAVPVGVLVWVDESDAE